MVLVSGRRGGYYGCFASYNQGICKNRSLVRREKIERNFLDYLREHVVKDPEVIQYATQKYNEIVKNYLRKAPNKKRDLERELQKVSTELSKLVQFIVEADAPDLDTIRLAIRERESSKARISEELIKLSNTQEKRFLITPYLVQNRLETIIEHIAAKGDRYNGIVKKILKGPLTLSKKKEETMLNGLLDIGGAMGASHCSIASQNFRTMNRLLGAFAYALCPHLALSKLKRKQARREYVIHENFIRLQGHRFFFGSIH